MGFLELARLKIKEIEAEQTTQTLDQFWLEDILPRLSRLHMAGRLPDLSACPLWNQVDRLWLASPPDAAGVKQAMKKALEAYEMGSESIDN